MRSWLLIATSFCQKTDFNDGDYPTAPHTDCENSLKPVKTGLSGLFCFEYYVGGPTGFATQQRSLLRLGHPSLLLNRYFSQFMSLGNKLETRKLAKK